MKYRKHISIGFCFALACVWGAVNNVYASSIYLAACFIIWNMPSANDTATEQPK